MSIPIRTISATAVATLAATALVALPAAATAKQYPWNATIDCGAGPVKVGSGNDIWSPLVDIETGHKYRPVAWRLKAGDKVIRARKPGKRTHKTMKCSYEDQSASGTVTVLRRKR